MNTQSDSVSKKAKFCLDCPICRAARKKQRGIAYAFVKLVDRKVCPACKAYEKATGQRAYEPVNEEITEKLTADS
ncbi:MAG: hypothetical protein NT018_12020 [Armatimonadetes bacterium]|nr:hypothetical protein [Armatimonadota bacterium]